MYNLYSCCHPSPPVPILGSKMVILGEVFIPETLNQQFCRLILSVHKKTSRLAVLGELGHYPLLTTSFVQTLKYKWSITLQDSNNLICDALAEMENLYNSGEDCWLTRVQKIEQMCYIPSYSKYHKKELVGNSIKN